MSDRKRLLPDLRVIDLRAELEKRSLDKSGVRGVLIQRLSKYLEEEGHDPATYRFGLSDSENKSTPTKRTRRSESVVEPEKEETPAMEDMIVQDDAGDEEETESGNDASQSAEPEQGAANGDGSMDVDANDKANRKRDIKDESEEVPAKKPCLDKEDDHKTENNTDADDSINLDLGDDELLNEETDSTSKLKKDDAGNDDAAETAGDDSAADSAAAATDAEPADDQANAEAPATSTDDGDNAENNAKDKASGDKKDKKDDGKEGGARNLWVSGLSGDTRAKDLKQLCSKHGKVIGAKVVTNARTPGSRCYGYVTMASSQDAENCIKNLHRTELHGRMISVEKAKSESESAARRQPQRPERRGSKDNKEEGKDTEKTDDNEKGKDDGEKRSVSRSREKSHRSDKDRGRRSTKSRDKKSPLRVLSFSKIWKERDIARQRERSRAAREDERRRRAAEEALRERERRQRQEKQRLQLEREKLRAEREKIEREKNELLRLERERHRLEREKLELERLELKRAQLRLEEERRKRGYEASTYRKAASPPQPAYERDTRHKRAPPPPMVSATHYQYKPALNTNNKSSNRGQFEAPPPPRFEMSSYDRSADKRERDRGDYKRDYRHVSSSNIKYPSNGNINDDARQPLPPGTRPKEPSRSYESRDTRSYRPSPPGKPEPRSWNASTRYPDTTTAAKGTSGGGNEAWSSSEPRYGGGGGGAAYEARYPPAYTPAATTTAYPDRYAPARDYRKY